MTDKPEKETARDAEKMPDISDTGRRPERRVTPVRMVLGLAVIVAICGSIAFTLGLPQLRTGLVVKEAFVRGAVSQIGTAEDARITKLHVKLGDRVARGDPLVDLSNDLLLAERAAAQARVERYRAEVETATAADDVARRREEVRIELARSRADETEARINRERAEVDLLSEEVARSETLADDGFATQARLEQSQAALAQAEADLDLRRVQKGTDRLERELAQIARREADVRQAERAGLEARLAEAQARLAAIEVRLRDRTLVALDDGIVVDVPSRPGASVGTDDPILSIWDPDRTWMLGWVAQTELERIRVGDPARIRIDTLEGAIKGIVSRILVAADGQERMLPGQPVSPLLPGESRFGILVEFNAAERAGEILPGMSGSIEIDFARDGERSFLSSMLGGDSSR